MSPIELVVPVFSLIAVGWLLAKIGLAGDNWVSALNDYAYYVAFPALMLASLATRPLSGLGAMIVANAAYLVVSMGLAFLTSRVLRLDRTLTATLVFSGSFGNIVYMGFPLAERAFGDFGLTLAAGIASTHLAVMLSIGLALAQAVTLGRVDVSGIAKRVGKVPLFWAAAAGLLLSTLEPKFPELVVYPLQSLGRSASPVALFALGAFLGNRGLGTKISRPLTVSAYKLIVLPVIAYALSAAAGLQGAQMGCTLLLSAAPLAVTNFVVADKFQLDREAVAAAIVLSTLCSVLTLSALAVLL
ncbi:MAG TPA: AEC family transporter [Candidatus Korarchaeota archaeon]|nr:AEC family transporter [Candidatus Korarchaeota archaeon]